MTCSLPDCDRPAARGGKCWRCIKNYQRNGTYTIAPEHAAHGIRYESARDRLQQAARSFADVDGFDTMAYTKAWQRLERAVLLYQKRGKVKP